MLQRPSYLSQPNAGLLAKASAGLGISQPPRISLKDDRFTLIQANGEPHPSVKSSLELDVIIVGTNNGVSQIYYDGAYDPTSPAAPACWSDNQIGPSKDAMQPQSETCALCPRAVWDQISPNGTKVPACNQHKKIAVIVAGGGATVYLLSIPPASLKPWRGYVTHLGSQNASPDEIVTRVSMADKTLKFEPVDFIPEAVVAMVRQVMGSEEPDLVTGNMDRPRTVALPAREVGKSPLLAAPYGREITDRPEDRQVTSPIQYAADPASPSFGPTQFGTGPKTPTAMEYEAEIARLKALAQQGPVTRKPRVAKETVVGAGPIPAATFGQAGGAFISQPPVAPQTNGAFGIQHAPPPDEAVNDMLAMAFGVRTQ